MRRFLLVLLLGVGSLVSRAGAVRVDAVSEARAWFDWFKAPAEGGRPFSFCYGDRPGPEPMAGWSMHFAERALDERRTERVMAWTDPVTKLEVRAVAIAYRDFPTVEWTVHFKNLGETDSPILSEIQALDVAWTRSGSGDCRLRYSNGTMFPPAASDFMPQEKVLALGSSLRLVPRLGRPTADVMPYFNLERGDGSGVIAVLGWSGAWAAEFAHDAGDGVRVKGGLERTHLKLHPGEEIRSPLVVLQSWRGDWIDAQNAWRRWMLACNIPRPEGRPPATMLAACSSPWYDEMINADEASQLRFIARYREEKIPIDIWWMDAGWYENHGSWQQPKNLRVDRARFPRGLRAITDVMHAQGLKSVVWFEPLRVMPNNELAAQHPEWLLANPTPGVVSKLLNLGDPAARAWLTDLVSERITQEGIDIYREDHCIIEMSSIWRAHDAFDRQGITENHHVAGLYAFWDELRRRFPKLVIDDCGGGGSRLDLELMRRSLPFFRSDHIFDPVSNQSQTYGLALWLPYSGQATGPTQFSRYELRSNFTAPLVVLPWDVRDRKLPYEELRRAADEWCQYGDLYLADFYPLTPDTLESGAWVAWQYHHPAENRGMIQAFRRDRSATATMRFALRGLDAAAEYFVRNLDDRGSPRRISGREAMERGVDVTVPAQPGAVTILYERYIP